MANVVPFGKDLTTGQSRPILSTDALIDADGTALGGTVDQRQETFTPTLAQTAFVLAATPADTSDVRVFVNGVKYIVTSDFTVSGTTVTWLDTPFALDTLDTVEIVYLV